MLSENIDYLLMMQNTMILANCNPCEAFVMVMTENEHDKNKNQNNIAEWNKENYFNISYWSIIFSFFFFFFFFG